MIRKNSEALVQKPAEGMTRKVLLHGGKLMAVEFTFAAGTVIPPHSHPHEQIGYFVKGRFEMTVGGETRVVEAGDSYYAPSGVLHGVKVLEDGMVLDVFSPPREDFLTQ